MPSSERTAAEAKRLGIPLTDFATHRRLDLAIDGADQVTVRLSDRRELVWLALSCSPCHKKICPLGHLNCLRTLGVDQVSAAAARLLSLPAAA